MLSATALMIPNPGRTAKTYLLFFTVFHKKYKKKLGHVPSTFNSDKLSFRAAFSELYVTSTLQNNASNYSATGILHKWDKKLVTKNTIKQCSSNRQQEERPVKLQSK